MGLLFSPPSLRMSPRLREPRRLRYMAMSKTAVLACKETDRVILPVLELNKLKA